MLKGPIVYNSNLCLCPVSKLENQKREKFILYFFCLLHLLKHQCWKSAIRDVTRGALQYFLNKLLKNEN